MSNSFSTVALNVQQRAIKPSFALTNATDESRKKQYQNISHVSIHCMESSNVIFKSTTSIQTWFIAFSYNK